MDLPGKRYDIMVSLTIANGSFNDLADVMKYIEYRLNLRSRDTDRIRLDSICLLSENNVQLSMDNC